ncbi:reverse transcriptase domain-containing protein [Tanacetum coccineum]
MMSNELKNTMSSFFQMQSPSGLGSLPSNTIANPRVPILKPDVAPKPNPKPSIPYPSRLNDQKLREKANNQMLKFLQIFQRLHFDLSFMDALLHMPKFDSTFKSLLSNKEKLFELANTPLNENCSALDECLALADLGASINLMPLSVWKKLSLPKLTPTRVTLELANRLVAYPVGVAEDVFVKVGKFHFLANFVVVDYDVDPRVPLILRRPFLRTARALIDGDILLLEKLLNEDPSSPLPLKELHFEELKMIKYSIDDPLKLELKDLPSHLDPWVSPVHCVPKKGGMTVVTNEDNELIPTRLVTRWRVCIDYQKLNDATRKDHFPLPFMDQMLERLAVNEYYCFLDGFSGYFHIPIDPQDQEKTTFTCPYRTFAY